MYKEESFVHGLLWGICIGVICWISFWLDKAYFDRMIIRIGFIQGQNFSVLFLFKAKIKGDLK
ncbi:hypothetical protein [Cytobacillus sp. BC1816]|uniref:hypothetical protein n=1 Tax=Cytobacillus sp. BC1816 TaxID=3440154 RepID=UPI003F50FBE7